MTQIEHVLINHFAKHRIVFWYDAAGDIRADFDAVALAGVEKVVVDGTEFGVKYRVLKQEPERHFLLYFPAPRPNPADNWLLDVLLSNTQFHGDKDALLLAELGLDEGFRDLIVDHRAFFEAKARIGQLRAILRERDTPHQIRLKMCAVCAGLTTDPVVDLVEIVFALFDEASNEGDSRYGWIKRFNLDGWLWARVDETWGYRSPAPTPLDFAVYLFAAGYAPIRDKGAAAASPSVHSLLRRWKDSAQHKSSFETLSEQVADLLDIPQDVAQRDFRRLAETDLFEVVDRAIIEQLVVEVAGRTTPAGEIAGLVEKRRSTRWFAHYGHEYEAILAASSLLEKVATSRLDVPSLQAGVKAYAHTWFAIDQAYRHFIQHTLAAGRASLFDTLATVVENTYANQFLYKLANNWQERIDAQITWPPEGVTSQMSFFTNHAEAAVSGDAKLFVIVSDALRYEVADELLSEIRGLDRYEVELAASLSPLPSYTQLGMAALLPHNEPLRIDPDGGTVYLGAKSTAGIANRRAILQAATNGKATAITAEEFSNMTWDEYRALYRDYRVVYLFHDVIDERGHSLATEERVFSAVEEAIKEIVGFVRKATNANFLNIVITADHGFLYQHRPIDESDFAATPVVGGVYQDRRFVMGKSIEPSERHKHFAAANLGLTGEYVVALPKGMLRLRKSGSSIRYVHGGATLQEVVVPILTISKSKRSDLAKVEVQLVRNGSSVISTNQFSVRFFQVEPVGEKAQPRRLTIALYAKDGSPLSDSVARDFASTDPLPQRREQTIQLMLNQAAEEFNNQSIELRLVEVMEGTSVEKIYRTETYTLRRAFGSDFDF